MVTGRKSVTFDTAKTVVLDLGQKGYRKILIAVPALATDSYVTVSVSHDGTTYLTLSVPDGAGSEYDVEIPSARSRSIDIVGAQYIKLTAPTTNQTVTVKAIYQP